MVATLATLLILAITAHGGTRPVRTPDEVVDSINVSAKNLVHTASEQSA